MVNECMGEGGNTDKRVTQPGGRGRNHTPSGEHEGGKLAKGTGLELITVIQKERVYSVREEG